MGSQNDQHDEGGKPEDSGPAELGAHATELEGRVPPATVGSGTDDERLLLEKAAALHAADHAETPAATPAAPDAGEGPADPAEAPDAAPLARPDAIGMPTVSLQVEVKDFHFPALPNGLDFLSSAVELLARPAGPLPRDLKYAVLHLRTAVEILLKARLEMHNPADVWTKRSEYDAARHKAGAFDSCSAEKAIGRLNALAGDKALVLRTTLSLEDPALAALKELRNRLTHFGWSDTAEAVRARTLPVLTLLLNFLRLDVLPYVEDAGEAWTAEREMEQIRGQLQHLTDYVVQRKAEIADQLHGHEDVTVACRSCGQYAVVLSDGAADLTCHFCGKGYGTGMEAAWEYIGEDRHTTIKDGGEDLASCSTCGEAAIVGAPTTASPDSLSYICFGCGADHNGVCAYCGCAGHLAISDIGEDMCENCYETRLSHF
ncbi:hypothetical protein ACFXHD_00405 [Streptomyces hydrogenans]|uniref:hypothetical protein n=1 Tax=Streptomyces hydrogenans TaxID=1873719 RepID=UPI0036984ECC